VTIIGTNHELGVSAFEPGLPALVRVGKKCCVHESYVMDHGFYRAMPLRRHVWPVPPGNFFERVDNGPYYLAFVTDYLYGCALAAHALFCVVFFALGVPLLGAVNIVSCLIYVAARALNRRMRIYQGVALAAFEVLAHATLASIMVGWTSGFAVYILVLLAILPLVPLLSNRIRVVAGLLLAAYFAGLLVVDRTVGPVYALNPLVLDILGGANLVVGFTFVCLIVHFLSQATRHAQQRVEELARTDFLTGLHNRRSMIEKLDSCRADYERNGTPFGIIIGDLDDFKRVNDRYGHEAGDRMLRAIADTVERCLRPTDSLGRWGGEEFLVLLPNTERKDANRVARRILETVRTVGVDVEDSTLGITISLGSITYRPHEDISSLVARADAEMYKAKQAGKDRLFGGCV